MTLIEVIAGLALLGTLLSLLLLARARHIHRAAESAQRLAAVTAADELLSTWWARPEAFPRSGGGDVPNHPALRWRTLPVPNPGLAALDAAAVRLEITDARNELLTSVELALPAEGGRRVKPLPRLHAR
jgi:type II secretory pathway pseudopilin PulG